MNRIKKSLLVLLMLCLTSQAFAKNNSGEAPKTETAPAATPNILESVKVDADENISAVSLLFPVGIKTETITHDLTDHGMFFQINISNTTTANPGQFLPGQGPYVSKIAIFQAKEDMTAVRIFTTEKTSAIRNALKVETVENRLLVTIQHQGVIADKEKQALVGSAQKEAASSPVPAKTKNGLHDQIEEGTYKAAIFSAILFAAFLIFTLLRPRLKARRNKNEGMPAEVPTFKKLGSMALAPKQKIIVMEISGEKILLATTPQGIQFLTKLDSAASRPSFVAHLQQEHVTPDIPRLESTQMKKQTIDLQQRPAKNLPDGARRVLQAIRDKKFARQEDSQPEKDSVQETEVPTADVKPRKAGKSKLSIRIDDDGVTDLNQRQDTQAEQGHPHSVEDITAMIRRKLKDLPKIV